MNNHLLVVSQKRYCTLNHSVCSSKNACVDSKNPPLLFQKLKMKWNCGWRTSSLWESSFDEHKLSGIIRIKNNTLKKKKKKIRTTAGHSDTVRRTCWEVERSVGRHICKKTAICGLPVVTDLMSEFYSKCNVHHQDWAIYEKRLNR